MHPCRLGPPVAGTAGPRRDTRTRLGCLLICLLHAGLIAPGNSVAQAGPPFLTNDPGTPGPANWEINLASMQTTEHGVRNLQMPQIDLNYGVGERVQLTFEIPYVIEAAGHEPQQSGWSNAYPGLKWRFLDQGEDGWQASAFPQVQTGSSIWAQQRGIADPGPRLLLPLEVSRAIGTVHVDVEAGYYVPKSGARERILGLVVGHSLTDRLELDAELYDDRASGAQPHFTALDFGGRYRLSRSFFALFMAGRSVSGTAAGQPEFLGYAGIQILLSDYGRSLSD